MGRLITFDIAAAALLIAAWYWFFRHRNRKRGQQVLRWLEQAFEGHGFIAGVEWLSASSMQVRLRVVGSGFRRLSVLVRLLPREAPLHWLVSRFRKRRETLTFEADLAYPPNFSLEVYNHRWCGRTRRTLASEKNWTVHRVEPFIVTSRADWQREIKSKMETVSASREFNFLQIRFRRATPHFIATVPLTAAMDDPQIEAGIFDALRELAAGASTSRF